MSPRISALDALRGFALAGIVEFNIVQMSGFDRPSGAAADHLGAFAWESGFVQRFFPIFSFLFGISFALFLRAASRRTDRPRLVLFRRLVWLAVFGALHTLVQHGEVLKFYALFGVLVLVPASYLSRRWVLALGAVLTVAGWLAYFRSNREQLVALLGEEVYRVWELYLVGGSMAFRDGRMGVDQILMVRPDGAHTLPLVRDW